MDRAYENLSQLLQRSIPAEAYFSQLPEEIQMRAVAHGGSIRTQRELRAFARQCAQEKKQ